MTEFFCAQGWIERITVPDPHDSPSFRKGWRARSIAGMTPAIPAHDAPIWARECNRGMDSFDTWPLIAAPILGVAMVLATAIATLLGA